MPCKKPKRLPKQFGDSSVYWFARFESACLKDDPADAQYARLRLERLGYAVDRCEIRNAKGGA